MSIFRLCSMVLLGLAFTACATIVNGSRQTVMINSTPDGAFVALQGNQVGKTPWTGEVPRQSNLAVTVSKTGFESQYLRLDGRLSGWIFGDIICCGALGTTTDVISGGAYEYNPGAYHVALEVKEGRDALSSDSPVDRVSKFTNERDARIKRYVLIYYKEFAGEIAGGKGEHVSTLKEFMNLSVLEDSVFTAKIKDDYAKADSADNFAERMILMAK